VFVEKLQHFARLLFKPTTPLATEVKVQKTEKKLVNEF